MRDEQTIKCVILTMRKENVVLPNANIAEILSVKEIERPQGESPPWYMGEMGWRGQSVPLLSFEAAEGDTVSTINLNTQAVVLHSAASVGDASVPFVALVMSGVPHITHFQREQLVIDDNAEEEPHPMVAHRVRINGARLSILDIDAMAQMVVMAKGGETLPETAQAFPE